LVFLSVKRRCGFGRFGVRYGWRVATAQGCQEAQEGAELLAVAAVEAVQRGEDSGVGLGGVGHGEVVDVFVGHEHATVFVLWDARTEAAALVFEDGFFHECDAEAAPFCDGEIVNEMTFAEVAGFVVGTGGGDEVAEPGDTFGADGVDTKFAFEVGGVAFGHETSSFGEKFFMEWVEEGVFGTLRKLMYSIEKNGVKIIKKICDQDK
jgi:hypothetical protein